jgi:uncharacterized protein
MLNDHAEAMKLRLRADLKLAMQARRTPEVQLLRCILAAIDNAQAPAVGDLHDTYVERIFGDGSAEVPRLALSHSEVESVLSAEIAERRVAADEMMRLGNPARAQVLRLEAELVERYLAK